MEPKSDGQLAYERYAEFTGGKTYDGKDMPVWSNLGSRIQGAWEHAVGGLVADRDAWKKRAAQHGCNTEEGDHECG